MIVAFCSAKVAGARRPARSLNLYQYRDAVHLELSLLSRGAKGDYPQLTCSI